MKLSKVVTWFLACVVLVLGAVSAVAATTVKGSKSNSDNRVVCRDLACCKANPKAMASNGQPCSAILSKNSGHASEQKGRGLGIAAHKEGQPATPVPTPVLTPASSTGKTIIQNIKAREQASPSLVSTPAPVEGRPVKQQVETAKDANPTKPTPGPAESINLNSSRSNIYRVATTPTPTPKPTAKKQQQKAQR